MGFDMYGAAIPVTVDLILSSVSHSQIRDSSVPTDVNVEEPNGNSVTVGLLLRIEVLDPSSNISDILDTVSPVPL